MPFHIGKGGVYIGPNWFEFRAQKYYLLDFRGPGDTTAIIGRYYRLALLGDRAQAIPPLDRGGTIAKHSWETELLGDATTGPSGATAGQEFWVRMG